MYRIELIYSLHNRKQLFLLLAFFSVLALPELLQTLIFHDKGLLFPFGVADGKKCDSIFYAFDKGLPTPLAIPYKLMGYLSRHHTVCHSTVIWYISNLNS